MKTQEIFDKLMTYRDESVLGDNKTLDEYFDAIMYSVGKQLGLDAQQCAALAGEEAAPVETIAIVEPVKPAINPSEYEITDGYVGSFGVSYKAATEETLAEAIEGAAKRNNKTETEIIEHLLSGGAVAWCDSPNHYYDHGKGIIRPKRAAKPVLLVKCSCGHSVPQAQVMSASTGSSCPECYDRMSN